MSTTGVTSTVVLPGGFRPSGGVTFGWQPGIGFPCESAQPVFVYVPTPVAVTFTVTLHEAMPLLRSPLTVTTEPPTVAPMTPFGQVVLAPVGLAIVSPAGRLSVKDQPFLASSSSVLVIVKVRAAVPPCTIDGGTNVLSSCGVTSISRTLSNAPSLPFVVPLLLYISTPMLFEVARNAWLVVIESTRICLV